MGMDTYVRVYKKNSMDFRSFNTFGEFGSYRNFYGLLKWCRENTIVDTDDSFVSCILNKNTTETLITELREFDLDETDTYDFYLKCSSMVDDLKTALGEIDWETEELRIEFSC